LFKAGSRFDLPYNELPQPEGDDLLDEPAVIPAGEVAFFITGLENLAVLNDDADTPGETYFTEEL
jgi:hypothetical protein